MKKISRGRKLTVTNEADFLFFCDRRTAAKALDPDIDWYEISDSEAECAWRRVRDRVLSFWTEQHPGSRPWAFWRFDAPAPKGTYPVDDGRFCEPRRLLSGAGRPTYESVAIWPRCGFGVLLQWDDTSENDPLTFEAQSSYLRRHNLLTPGEAERSDFEPEVIRDFGKYDLTPIVE